jgi:hypothetical protein
MLGEARGQHLGITVESCLPIVKEQGQKGDVFHQPKTIKLKSSN